jgi:hypothetical protein
LRDHPGETLHDQVAGAWIPLQDPEQRFAFDLEQPAFFEAITVAMRRG